MFPVVVVEDNEDIRGAVAEYFRGEGYEVHEAEHGRQGLELLAELGVPCVILLDLMMPVMSGVEMLQALEASGDLAKHPVIVVSAAMDLLRKDVPQARHIVRKPPNFDLLARLVREVAA